MSNKTITVALAGNPNSGKTTIFNSLTGSRKRIGNYPGVTVEKEQAVFKYKGYQIKLVDLPGIYSLTAHSIDEIVARNFIIDEKPDVVVNIIDASNLERNLYLTTQLMELNLSLILAFNMYDLAQREVDVMDLDKLSQLMGTVIITTTANKKKGLNELLDEVIRVFKEKPACNDYTITYGSKIQEEIEKIEEVIRKDDRLAKRYSSRWLAIKLLEGDDDVSKKAINGSCSNELVAVIAKSVKRLKVMFGDDLEAIFADKRYGYISGACSEAVVRSYELRHTTSDQIDKLLINRVVGLPIFLVLMWSVFKFTFVLSEPLVALIENGQNFLANLAVKFLPVGGAIQSLVVDGIIGGVGSVLVFVPIIFLLFLAMGFLEYSGYMARAAFIMDGFMHKLGLHGRSVIPMLLGFGCNVPAIMATRTINDKRDRLVTILVNPFMSCGARLPVYTLFIAAFFSQEAAGNVLFSLYLIGIVVAIIMAKIFRNYMFRGEANAFVMELPPYRLPALKGLLIHVWDMVSAYLKKAGTIIFVACVAIWFLSNFPHNHDIKSKQLEQSYAGKIGKAITPVFEPLGFADWRTSVALIGGFGAKEVIIATLGTVHSVGDNESGEALRVKLQNAIDQEGRKLFTKLSVYSLMVFILLYMPCAAVIAVIKRETGSWRWSIFAVFYTTVVAWMFSFIIYQGGLLLGLG
ncbi:MAG: ferrous iron transport protein B [Candidatus Omnitrophica bacterium]|nr:ferrous iron transport protein B [Candidatus Omnitrophota bacterium]